MQVLKVKCDVEVENQIVFADACDAIISALNAAKDKALNQDVIEDYGTIEDLDGNLLGEWTLGEKAIRRG